MAQCQGKSKQSGAQCKRPAVAGQNVCYMHGGATPSGIALPQTTTGRYSRHLPTRLLERYEQAASDGELLVLREDIALLDARLTDVLDAAAKGESGELWNRLKEAKRLYDSARGKKAEDQRRAVIGQILNLIEDGYKEWQTWKDIRFLLQDRCRLVESERRRIVEMQTMMDAKQANLLFTALAGVVRKHVTDKSVLAAIQADLVQLGNHPDRA